MVNHNPITNPIEYHIDNPYILKKIQDRSFGWGKKNKQEIKMIKREEKISRKRIKMIFLLF